MLETSENTTQPDAAATDAQAARADFDYTYVNASARIALYDDLKSAPRIMRIDPAPTADFIEHLASTIDEQAKRLGGKIPYTAVREVSENFIHAQFRDIVVSILDEGNTIRFADQGPGIAEKDKAQKPGFTSAIEPMKDYIRGVGSGLPIVREWVTDRNGSLAIEDNLTHGAVVTISLVDKPSPTPDALPAQTDASAFGAPMANIPMNTMNGMNGMNGMPMVQPMALPHIPLTTREQTFLKFLFTEGELGITDMSELAEAAVSTVHSTFDKLEQHGLVAKTPNRKRSLTPLGIQVAQSL